MKTKTKSELEKIISSFIVNEDWEGDVRSNGINTERLSEILLDWINANYVPISEVEEIIVWLLGYNNFPSRKDGEGKYYWRTYLRKKLERSGIRIPTLEEYLNIKHK